MVSAVQFELIQAAEKIYADRLRSLLEPGHDGEFVAIEPVSGEYFLGKTLSEAIQAARRTHPSRLPYAMRVGTRPAIHLGTWR
ncbi:MAG: hypothetical protein JWN70_5345 [Planctomycetaceae bacterium]|nr:hypothetical protein [Planctomycetaceae bacterium]